MSTTERDFDTWMEKADQCLLRNMGISIYDLPDKCYRDWFESGMSPGTAAYKALSDEADELGFDLF